MLEVLYDGSCSFCSRWAKWIRLKDTHSQIRLTDINERPGQRRLGLTNISWSDAISEIHGTDGLRTYKGADLVLRILALLGFKKTAWLLRLPGIFGAVSLVWRLISRYRKSL